MALDWRRAECFLILCIPGLASGKVVGTFIGKERISNMDGSHNLQHIVIADREHQMQTDKFVLGSISRKLSVPVGLQAPRSHVERG